MAAASPRRAALAAAAMIAVAATEWVGVLLLVPLLQLVGISTGAQDAGIVRWFAAAFAAVGLVPTLGSALAFYVLVASLRTGLLWFQTNLNTSLREEYTLRLRERMYLAIGGAEWKFLVTRRAPEFAHILAGEVTRVGTLAFQGVGLAISIVIAIAYVGLAFKLSPAVAALVLGSSAVMGWISLRRMERARQLGNRAWSAKKGLHSLISEHVSSMKTAKSYGAGQRHADAFGRLSSDLRNVTVELTADQTGLRQNLELAWTVLLAVIVFAAHDILGVSPVHLLVVLFICMRLMPRIMEILRQVHGLTSALPVIDVLDQLERECLENAEPVAPAHAKIQFESAVTFESVAFSYLGRAETPALKGVDLEIKAGLTTAIVGTSGSGKSTMADLLIGLLIPTGGRILVDGVPLAASDRAAWRESVAYVPQDTFLFHDTIRQNLTWSRAGADEGSLWKALRLAAASEFVAALPHGLDTIVGERGVLLSGGERQRLSLARALLRDPRILVLDEATSSLDSETERRIQLALDNLHNRMTIVIVTHRLSMISGADTIHVLHHGRLVESGTWDQLLSSDIGRFRDLCRAQGIYERPRRLAVRQPA